jgi:Tol biopolymer transport system component
MKKGIIFLWMAIMLVCSENSIAQSAGDSLLYTGEKHFKNIQQLTFGGDNAEAYWSYDSKYLIFQKTSIKEGIPCDQMYIGKVPTKAGEKFVPKLVSTGKGRTTCGFFMKNGKHVLYASTHLGADTCPPAPK